MKKLFALWLCLAWSVCFASPLAAAEVIQQEKTGQSDLALTAEETAEFCEQVADDEAFVHLAVTAAQKKERKVSLEGVHPGPCLKLYGMKGSDNPVEDLSAAWEETGRIGDRLTEDYAVLVLYLNQQGDYVDSLVFTRQENLPGAQDKNGWVPLGSGSLATGDDLLENCLQEGGLDSYAEGLGVADTQEMKLIASIPHLPVSLYFEQQGEEYLLPLEDGLAEMHSAQVYRAGDVVQGVLQPILAYWEEQSQQQSDEMMIGAPLVPTDLPALEPVDLQALPESDPPSAAVPAAHQQAAPVQPESPSFSWPIAGIAAAVLVLAAGATFWVKRRKA